MEALLAMLEQYLPNLTPPGKLNLTLNKFKSLPFETTSSMHHDFKNKKSNTELQTLTGFVITESNTHSIATPTYIELYK